MFVGLTCFVEDWWPVWCHVDMRKCVCVLHLSTWVPAAVYSQLQSKEVWQSTWTVLGWNYWIWNNMAVFGDFLGCLLKQTMCDSSCGMIETTTFHSWSVFTTALDSRLNKTTKQNYCYMSTIHGQSESKKKKS